jgi:hypothetical protein
MAMNAPLSKLESGNALPPRKSGRASGLPASSRLYGSTLFISKHRASPIARPIKFRAKTSAGGSRILALIDLAATSANFVFGGCDAFVLTLYK